MQPAFHNDEIPTLKPPENFTYNDTAVGMEIDEVKVPFHQL